MNATTPLSTQTQKRPGIRQIMTWNGRKDLKNGQPFGHSSTPDDPLTAAPASPTPSVKSIKNNRPSLFAVFARRNSTKSLSEYSSRSRSPTSPRPSTEYGISPDGFRTPSPTPSRNSMIFERDIEPRDHLSANQAVDLGIPPVLDELFASDELPTILTEDGSIEDEEDNTTMNTNGILEIIDGEKMLSSDIVINRQPSPGPFEQGPTIAETIRSTSPKELNELAGK